jgi:hypothetical protein
MRGSATDRERAQAPRFDPTPPEGPQEFRNPSRPAHDPLQGDEAKTGDRHESGQEDQAPEQSEEAQKHDHPERHFHDGGQLDPFLRPAGRGDGTNPPGCFDTET